MLRIAYRLFAFGSACRCAALALVAIRHGFSAWSAVPAAIALWVTVTAVADSIVVDLEDM